MKNDATPSKSGKTEISSVMHELATYISKARKAPLPKPIVEKTKHHVLDTIAAMVSGSKLLPGEMAISYIKTRGGVAEATVIGSRIVTSAENAALANGMLAHADETDDSHDAVRWHPGCAVVPAALAVGEQFGIDGAHLLRAIAPAATAAPNIGPKLCVECPISRKS